MTPDNSNDPFVAPQPGPVLHARIGARLRNYFLTGLILVGPLFVTAYLTWSFVTWVDGLVRPLIPPHLRPKVYTPHPVMSADDIRRGTQSTWDAFYSLSNVWQRAQIVKSLRGRLAFLFISKLYRQMYANTGIATDSARMSRSTNWARLLAKPCRKLFVTSPMPELEVPN